MPERQVHVLPSFHSQMMNMICFVFPTQDEINDWASQFEVVGKTWNPDTNSIEN